MVQDRRFRVAVRLPGRKFRQSGPVGRYPCREASPEGRVPPPGPAPPPGRGPGRGPPVGGRDEKSRSVTKSREAGDRVSPSHAPPAEGPHMTHFLALLNVFAATSSKKSGSPAFLIILVVIAVAGYFFFLRPQQAKARAARANVGSGYEVGDEVQTIGGVVGTILEIHGDRYTLLTGSIGERRQPRRRPAHPHRVRAPGHRAQARAGRRRGARPGHRRRRRLPPRRR